MERFKRMCALLWVIFPACTVTLLLAAGDIGAQWRTESKSKNGDWTFSTGWLHWSSADCDSTKIKSTTMDTSKTTFSLQGADAVGLYIQTTEGNNQDSLEVAIVNSATGDLYSNAVPVDTLVTASEDVNQFLTAAQITAFSGAASSKVKLTQLHGAATDSLYVQVKVVVFRKGR